MRLLVKLLLIIDNLIITEHMKTKKNQFPTGVLTALLFVGFFSNHSWGQTVNVFNVTGGGTIPSSWINTNAVTDEPIDKTSYYLVEAGNPSDKITTATFDLSYFASASFSLKVASFGGGTVYNKAKIEISYDGGVSYTETLFSSLTTGSAYNPADVFTLSSVSSQVKIKISNSGTTGRGVRLQSLILNGIGSSCTSSASISSFSPASGPVSTIIRISGSGFTGATAVKFGSVNASSFTVVDATTILATVPVGVNSTAPIVVFDASACSIISLSNFSLLSVLGTCDTYLGYTDLFISEIYDSQADNVWNIELFNPTANPITLTGNYQIKRAADVSAPNTFSRTIDLVGVVQPNSVFLIEAGNTSQVCSSISYNMTISGDGINEKDVIALFKNGTKVDVTNAPNEAGYSLLRNVATGMTAPKATYSAADWTVNSTESCLNLGVFSLPINAPNISSSPANVNACTLNMAVASSTAGISYQWKFNNPENMTTWLDVSSTNIPGVLISGETSANLVVSGNVSIISGYQFYCQITKTGCSSVSNAAQFQTETRSFYRSVALSNGVWSDYTNWEMSNDQVNYVSACAYPKSSNSSAALIQSGSYITLDLTGSSALEIDHLVVENNATLELLSAAKLTIYDSIPGADLLVDGTMYDRNSTTNGINLSGFSTWKLGPAGTIIRSNDGAITSYKDKYEGGMSSIPASANWIFRYNGDGNPRLGTVGFFFPNLTFENTTASLYSWNNPTAGTAFLGGSGFATVKGNLQIGVTGTAPCVVSNVNTNSQGMLIMGDLSIATGSELNNQAAGAFGTGFELKGNLLVDGSLQILSGSLERVLRFSGSGDQTVSGNGNLDVFKVTVNKLSGSLLLNRNLNAQNELQLTQGNILTNSHLLELGVSTSQKGILNHTDGFVVGKMRRWLDGTNSGNVSGLFPMGFEDLPLGAGIKNRNIRIEFTNAPTDGGHLTVEYIGSPMGFSGLPILMANSGNAGCDIVTTEDQGYWKIDNEIGKLLDGQYSITCTGENYQVISNLAKVTLLKRVGTGNWFCPGVHLATTGTLSMPIVSRSGVSGWSNFGFGGGIGNPLPIELASFKANCNENQVDIEWITASEFNTAIFVVEKSRDLVQWEVVLQVKATGNSNVENQYHAVDLNTVNGLFYYRLKEIDFNGQTEINEPISIFCVNKTNSMAVFPNPTNGDFTVEIQWNEPNIQAQLQILDIRGKVMDDSAVYLKKGTSKLEYHSKNLQAGIYWIYLKQQGPIRLAPIRLFLSN